MSATTMTYADSCPSRYKGLRVSLTYLPLQVSSSSVQVQWVGHSMTARKASEYFAGKLMACAAVAFPSGTIYEVENLKPPSYFGKP
jgi:hypothetical protein